MPRNYTKEAINAYKDKKTFDVYSYTITNNLGQSLDLNGIISPLERDNRDIIPPIEDQLDTPFCAAYSITTIFEALYWKKTGKLVQLDQNHVYAKAKEYDGHAESEGTSLDAAIKACADLCGLKQDQVKISLYMNDKSINTVNMIKHLVHKYDLIHVGMILDQSWFSCNNDNYIVPGNQIPTYGHAMVICGYDETGMYVCNSWGKHWGSNGMAICPWNIVLKELSYFATIDFC